MSCTDSAVSHIDYDSNYTENKYKKLICQYPKKWKGRKCNLLWKNEYKNFIRYYYIMNWLMEYKQYNNIKYY